MSRYRVKFTCTFPGQYCSSTWGLPRYMRPRKRYTQSVRATASTLILPSSPTRPLPFSPLRQPECSGNYISPYPPAPPSLLAAMLRSIPGWRALHPGRHPICPPHFPAQEGRQRGEKGRRNHPSRTCNRVAATASCRRHTGRARTGPCRVCCIDVAMSQVSHSKTTPTWRTRPSSRPRWQ